MKLYDSLSFKVFILLGFFIPLNFASSQLYAQSQLVKNLRAGKKQALIIYGTSLSFGVGGHAWADSVANGLNSKYGGLLTAYNTGKGGMWSTWGLQHLEDSVISKKPDAVLIEFGINDAFLDFKTSPELARLNLNYMIDRIKLYNPDCEVMLHIMNMPVNISANLRPNLVQYYDMYRQLAKKRKLLLIDNYPNWGKILSQGKEVFLKYVPDGIHPNAQSARTIIAPYVLKRLEEGR